MTIPNARPRAASRGWRAIGAALIALAGCAEPPPSSPPTNMAVPLDDAAVQASERLLAQARAAAGRATILDPMRDATTGHQTAATTLLEKRVTERLAGRLEILPFKSTSLASAHFLLTGTLSRGLPDRPKGSTLINLALTDLKTGLVVAQAWALARDDALDPTALPHDADGPARVRDQAIEGQVTTSATPAGKPASPYYLGRLAVATVINDANVLYDSGNYQEALSRYQAADNEPGGGELQALSGIYLAHGKLGHGAEADKAYARVVAYGIAQRRFSIEFLFNPGSTVFWSDPRVSGPYPTWLRQIARESAAANVCMNIIGHTSKTRSEAADDALSLQRASFIRQRLISEASVLAGRTRAAGRGSHDNLIGSGTDNAVDALDRRIEFRVVPCG